MFIKVTENIFRDWMNECYPNSFSYEGLSLLFNFLESCEDEDKQTEFDASEINGSFDEGELRNIAKNYNLTYYESSVNFEDEEGEEETENLYTWETMTDEMVEEVVKEYLQNETCLVGITKQGTAVYMSF